MAAKGSIAKKEIIEKILKTFEGSFLYNGEKEIRIPGIENGENLQIKITLTCAKTNVEPGEDTAIPGMTSKSTTASTSVTSNIGAPSSHFMNAPTEEEKKNVQELIEKLGL